MLVCVFIFERGGWDGWASIKPSQKRTSWIVEYWWVSWGWITLYVSKKCVFVCLLLFVLCYGDITRYVGGPGFGREISGPEWVGGYHNGRQ